MESVTQVEILSNEGILKTQKAGRRLLINTVLKMKANWSEHILKFVSKYDSTRNCGREKKIRGEK